MIIWIITKWTELLWEITIDSNLVTLLAGFTFIESLTEVALIVVAICYLIEKD